MGIGQLLPLVLVGGIAYYAFTRMKGMQAAASASYAELAKRLAAEFAASRQPGETDAAFVMASTRNKLSKNTALMMAVTNQRVLVQDTSASGPVRAFDRKAVQIAAPAQKWTDVGNMQTTVSEGWEVSLQLPTGEAYKGLRLYGEDPYYPQQAGNVPQFLGAIGQA
jgi:hypothetical protein